MKTYRVRSDQSKYNVNYIYNFKFSGNHVLKSEKTHVKLVLRVLMLYLTHDLQNIAILECN
jgi:hypothetical protein